MDSPWQEYRVGPPNIKNGWVEPECCPFNDISHVTHTANALSILRQANIRPQLVYDESVLNTRRILVNWISPNYWTPGSRYGNVSFDFDWRTLVANKRFYWVEIMDYRPPACRILVTDQDYNADSKMLPYDPRIGDGPWWWDETNDIHYRNSRICLEVMLETELSLSAVKDITFVLHHANYCCIDPSACSDRGIDGQEASARFLAGIIAEDIDVSVIPVEKFHANAGNWWFSSILPRDGYNTVIGHDNPAARALARGIAAAYYHRQNEELASLARLFSN